MSLTACFTGHRPKDLFPDAPYDKTSWQPLEERIEDVVKQLAAHDVTTFISGGAQGVDQTAFWAVHNAQTTTNVTNILHVPFDGQESRWREYGLFGRREWRAMRDAADEVVVLNAKPADWNEAARYLFARNQTMVDNSDIVIGITRESRNFLAGSGGTRHCLRYAVKHNRKLVLIDPHTLKVWHDDTGFGIV